ncbi:hypothetical protein DWQ67_02805 [Galactobacter caseinivorans]|uniref:Uncharacterized protein n=1 Tax=Galactobacter caseinivorans TaxID=2676123 RepID=A0A496PML7_9MICC|nr:hypothetical protein DWQ67_02805 [Galactobacter caseinivorans]
MAVVGAVVWFVVLAQVVSVTHADLALLVILYRSPRAMAWSLCSRAAAAMSAASDVWQSQSSLLKHMSPSPVLQHLALQSR